MRLKSAAFLALCAAIVVLANLGAWRGYFQGDDLDTLGWTRFTPFLEYLKWLALPVYAANHFRPAGHVLYWLLQRSAGLDFRWYLAALQLLHLLNVFLLWRVLQALRLGEIACGLGALFFSFHMAAIDAYWKPQFLFDVLCATFCLASLLLFAQRRFAWSFLCFWLAYKSKELAVMLPFVLMAYELLLGRRRWKLLIPFVAISLVFGLQGAVIGKREHLGSVYALHFTWKALAKTSSFYFSKALLVRNLGFAILLAPVFVRDRRVLLGALIFCLFLVPLLPLSDRTVDVYIYLPLTGLALMIAALADSRNGARVVAGLLALWLPWNYLHAQSGRRRELSIASQNRAYVQAAAGFLKDHGQPKLLVAAGWPPALAGWGAIGAFRILATDVPELHSFEELSIRQVLTRNPLVAEWLPRLQVLTEGAAGTLTMLEMTQPTSIFQLGSGWGQVSAGARWMTGNAHAVVYAGSGPFECVTRLRKWSRDSPETKINVFLDGKPAGTQTFHATGEQTSKWNLSVSPGARVQIEIAVEPPGFTPSAQVVRIGFAGK